MTALFRRVLEIRAAKKAMGRAQPPALLRTSALKRAWQLTRERWGSGMGFLVSGAAHLALLFTLFALPLPVVEFVKAEILSFEPEAPLPEQEPEDPTFDLAPPSDIPHENVLASVGMATALEKTDMAELLTVIEPLAVDTEPTIAEELVQLQGVKLSEVVRQGTVGEEIEHVEGAVDRLTHEIARNLEERDVLVVWLMDASGSLTQERAEVADRLNRVYQELDQLGAVTDEALLSSVIQFGEQMNVLVNPTDNGADVVKAIRNVQTDESGVENVFQTIDAAVQKYKAHVGRDKRKLMLVVWTDESGDDYHALENAVATCQRFNASVYSVGPSAMFGKEEGTVPYVHPEDGNTYYLPISRGPDALRQEQIQLPFWFRGSQHRNLNSGLGPFALTRICQSTGGIYFIKDDPAERNQFELDVMMSYTPEYDSASEYLSRARRSKFRSAILKSVDMTMQREFKGTPRLEFEPRGATYYNELREAQELVAYNMPIVDAALLPFGRNGMERLYAQEPSARWRAWYDYNRGRLLAMWARCYEYNWRCAELKGLSREFVEEKSNRWRFLPAEEYSGSETRNAAEEARRLLTRCIENNPGTPWATLARRELKDPIGFRVEEAYVAPPPSPARTPGNGNNNPPQTERPRRLSPPRPPKLPKL
ncbi:MAG: VWA domain-containing protein [Pirellulales bacterium]|nr:VWA domain-containing protein [Pirellulales bacterium]